MTTRIKYTALVALFVGTQLVSAQKKDENIGTEVVNVVKPYTPTISDAFKVKETPVLDDEETLKKENITYNIFSFPVASTFTPAKGKAASVDAEAKERLFQNYLTLGIGNYANANAELFVTQNLSDNSYVGGMLRHFSSQGGIKDALTDDEFSNTSLDLAYGYRTDALSWTADLGFKHQVYNWYGLNEDVLGSSSTVPYGDLDVKHTYYDFYAGTKVTMRNSFFKEAEVRFDHFWDSFDSAENRFYIKPSFEFDVTDTKVKVDFIVDYLDTQYKNDFGTTKFGYTNFGAHPSFVINRADWTINLGAAAFYSADMENSDNKFFIYPEVNASLKVVGDLMIFYTGAEGGLDQNSYRDFTTANPFVAPGLAIAPTDRQYDLYAGLRGKLASSVSYNVKAAYTSEKNKALFVHNDYPDIANLPITSYEPYDLGNSFGVVYDKVKTLSLHGELKADFSKNVSFGIDGTYNTYTTNGPEAWNLPTFTAGTTLDVDITPKWYTGFKLFFVGERKDFENISGGQVTTLDSYFDANAHLGYRHNERLTAFLKLNNIANQAYEKWLNYPVQQFQVMVGANYKFDF